MFEDAEPEQSVELVQVEGSDYQNPIVNKTKFNNPPLPVTKVPGNPCTDPNKGAPSKADKRAAKCTIKKSPQCYKLQSRFLAIQGGIADERDALMEEVAKLEASCKETKKTLETSIENDEALLASSQTKLAEATQKEAAAGESARQTAAQNEQLNNDLVKQMKLCSTHYIEFETELCALKKIRGELYKMKDKKKAPFFADCEVSKWSPEACTKKCAGGKQKLTRSVLTHPNGGAKCLPLAAMMSCNNGPCPVDCELHAWSGWSKCSADCGGGVTQRLRDVKRAMKHGGKPCGETSESKSCAIAACEKDCDLGRWTKWTSCSKDCDGGSKKRQRFIKKAAEGAGKCPGQWTRKRLQYRKCNMRRCRANIKCKKSMDIVLMLDGCPKSGPKAWGAITKAATNVLDRYVKPAKTNVAVIQFCGPRTWSGVAKCTGKANGKVNTEKVCKVMIKQHFSENVAKAKTLIKGLQPQKGEKLTELALISAVQELTLGRKTAPSVVIVFNDGSPLSLRKTLIASRKVRKAARLLWVPIVRFSPLKDIKNWASRRWQENIVRVKKFSDMGSPATATHIIANLCPSKTPKLKRRRPRKRKR